MGKYSQGQKVRKDGERDSGIILTVIPPRRGRQLYSVDWGSHTCDELEEDLIGDCNISDPYERCLNGIFGTYSEYSRKNTTFKIESSNNSTVSSLKASKTLFRAYQFKPLLKFLNSPNRRLLVADEVGLGKTIEAGHIMLELKARAQLQNVLIVCPKSLQVKWRSELNEKFGLAFRIYQDAKEFASDLQDQNGRVRAIVNYEKIRKSEKERSFYNRISDSDRRFSLIICDEAHKLRNSDTQIYKGAQEIMALADSALFLTATPVMISTENLYNLLHLLDNTRYFNPQIFNNLLMQNKPFIEAISSLNQNRPLLNILENLSSSEIRTTFSANESVIYSGTTTVGKMFADDPIYQDIEEALKSEDNLQNRARIQYLLSTMSVMNNVFSRTRKREVTMDMSQAERKPHMCKVVLTPEEQEIFDRVIDDYRDDNSYTDEWGEEVMTQGGTLGLVQKKRQVASSVYASACTEKQLDDGIDPYEEFSDSKVLELERIIKEVFAHGTQKIVVFALFRKTLKYLKIRLKKLGYNSLMIHGQIKDRNDILEEFRTNPDAHILLSSEVGSEGLDMQFCNAMVNYDLPWNPMVVEQRIGRIDRFGQTSPVVNIYNMVVAGSIQEDIYLRLLDRIGIFRGTIGDMEAILDAPMATGEKATIQDVYNKLEKELFTSKLSPEERNRKIAEVERAIENERENIKHLEEGLSNTLTNDAYFKDEIHRIITKNAYVTSTELENYIRFAIRTQLTTCNLTEVEPKVFEFALPISTPMVLRNFLIRFQPPGDEAEFLSRSFLRQIGEQTSIMLTFDQEKAYENKKLIYVNMYHPFIMACTRCFSQNENSSASTFSYALPNDDVIKNKAAYYLAVFKMSTKRTIQGMEKVTDTLFPVLYDIGKHGVVTDQTIIDHVFGQSQTNGIEHNPRNEYLDGDMIQDMRYDFTDVVNSERKSRLLEMSRQSESERIRSVQQTQEYYSSLIQNRKTHLQSLEYEIQWQYIDEKRKREIEGAIRLANANIDKLLQEEKERIQIINNNPEVSITDELLSLNLVVFE